MGDDDSICAGQEGYLIYVGRGNERAVNQTDRQRMDGDQLLLIVYVNRCEPLYVRFDQMNHVIKDLHRIIGRADIAVELVSFSVFFDKRYALKRNVAHLRILLSWRLRVLLQIFWIA